jgi:DNA helicase-2/ATP-dependent DNA helicase PcrA
MAYSLNASQMEAVRTLRGPLLVLAGAGAGKTGVVTHRIAELIRSGVPPQKILAVTFTNKAAGEMQERAGAMLGKRRAEKPEISTFHSLCVRVLRRHARVLGYPPQFAIYDRGDQESLARTALREIQAPTALLRPGDLLYFISRWKTASLRPDQAAAQAENDKEHLAAVAYRRYQRALKTAGAVDFDDLLLCTEELFANHADVRQSEADRFSHLLVDEYQDTNGSQYRIVKALAGEHRNLCVVGDDDQSIYGWRGAEVTHILHFQKDWPDARVIRLEENYRSAPQILEIANRLIACNTKRHDKVLRAMRPPGEPVRFWQCADETVEAYQVAHDIAILTAQKTVEPRDIAILCRTNEQPRPFETEFRRAKIPYVVIGGMSFYDRKEVRDVLAYLKVLAHPRDEVSLRRIINTPSRGISDRAVDALLERAVAAAAPMWDVLAKVEVAPGLTANSVSSVHAFRELIERNRARMERGDLVGAVKHLLDEISYRDEITRIYKDPNDQAARWNSVEEVINALAGYVERCERGKKPTLGGFIEDIALVGRENESDKDSQLKQNAVVLMTLHSAKGLEFPHVYLVGMEEGLLPHHRSVAAEGEAIDEERRLCYVGVTRARDRLTLSLASTRMKWGKPRPSIPSRFLFELRGEAEKASAAATRSTREAKGLNSAPTPPPKRKPARQSSRPAAGGKGPATGGKPKQR